MRSSECNGVHFYEGMPESAEVLCDLSTTVGGLLKSAQLSSLRDVKEKMAAACLEKGGNAIVRFKYGQRSSGLIASIFSRDDVAWYGSGQVAKV